MENIDKNAEIELKQKVVDLYNYMSEKHIGAVALDFESGDTIRCSIQYKPIHINLDEVLGE